MKDTNIMFNSCVESGCNENPTNCKGIMCPGMFQTLEANDKFMQALTEGVQIIMKGGE